jgi:hypothetical protein
VLALAPPLTRPSKLPDSVRIVSGFEPMSENFVRYMELVPWLRGVGTWIMRTLYVRISAFVLAELHMDSEESLQMFARYIAQSDPKLACLRAVREFALVARVSDAELRHALSGALQRIAFSESAQITVCWGSADTWLDVAACHERLLQKLELAEVPASRLHVHVLANVGHGVTRDDSPCHAQLAPWLWEAVEHACGAGSTTREGVEMELRS